jgi:electron transfer flavoprotein beta subunit
MPNNNLDILVLLRETSDPRPPAGVITRGAGISERGLRRLANPSDLAALEEALRLKEKIGATVTVLAIGPKRLDDLLHLAASVGADRLIRLCDHGMEHGDAVADARVLSRVMMILSPMLFFSGNRLLDRGDDPVPALASALLSRVCVNAVVTFSAKVDGIDVLRKGDRGGRQEVFAPYPCSLLFEEGASIRYPSVDALTGSVSAPVENWGLSHLGLPFWEAGVSGSYLTCAEFGVPRPDPVRVVTPDATLPAFERILSLLSGGIKAREGKLHQLSADATAEIIWRIFDEEGLTPQLSP